MDFLEIIRTASEKMEGKDPCWKGYEMVGTKTKNGKEVPNCVPKNKKKKSRKSMAVEAIKTANRLDLNGDHDQADFFTKVAKELMSQPLYDALGPMGFEPSLFEEDGHMKPSKQSLHRDKDGVVQEIWMEGGDDFMRIGMMEDGSEGHKHLYFHNIEELLSHLMESEPEDCGCGCGGKCGKREASKKKNVKLNKPFRTPGGPKKFSVYVKNNKGNVVKVNFGDPNMDIKRDDPNRRKNYRARHHCDNPGPKWKANYWSCRNWSKKPVSKIVK